MVARFVAHMAENGSIGFFRSFLLGDAGGRAGLEQIDGDDAVRITGIDHRRGHVRVVSLVFKKIE